MMSLNLVSRLPIFSEICSHWTLFLTMLKREITLSIKGSSLGILWLVLSPLCMLVLYTVVFGVLFKGSFAEQASANSLIYAVGIYIGMSLVNFINEIITRSCNLIISNENLVKKVVFPLVIFPGILTFSILFKLLVNCILWVAFLSYLRAIPNLDVLWVVPLSILVLVLLGLGISLIFSSICIYCRDIQQISATITQIIFWSSGIFYSASDVREFPQIWNFLQWNPLLVIIDSLRKVLLWNQSIAPSTFFYPLIISILTFLFGSWLFNRLKSGFSDLI